MSVNQPARRSGPRGASRAFTLIEAMIATGILSMSVLALSSAIAAGQKSSIEGQKALLGAMAISDLMSEVAAVPYADLGSLDGRSEAPGAMRTLDNASYPGPFWMIGRAVSVTDEFVTEPGLQVTIKGKKVVVTATDGSRDVASAETFFPEPAP